MLDGILDYTSTGHLPSIFNNNDSSGINQIIQWPQRMEGNRLHHYSKVLENYMSGPQTKDLPPCPHLTWALPEPLNLSAPT